MDKGLSPTKSLLWVVFGIVALRALVIALSPLDLFVDETQYWLWGQELAFGYYSKPPMIGWVLRLFDIFNFNGHPVWLRLPAPLFHGATALILAGLTKELAPQAKWAPVHAAALYLSMPIIGVGSFLISTDTIMAPFFVGGVWAYLRAIRSQTLKPALLAGILFGLAFLSKYAAFYALVGCLGAQLFVPTARIKWSTFALFLLAVLITFSPNIIWNILNGLTTASHTVDNASWVREGAEYDFTRALGFVASQAGSIGPGLFALAALVLLRDPKPNRWLLWLVLPAFFVVTIQAVLAPANANWAFASILGLAIALPHWSAHRLTSKAWQWAIYLPNALFHAFLITLLLIPTLFTLGNGQPVGGRYLGQDDLSEEIIARTKATGIETIFAENRSVLADLHYTGRDAGLTFLALKRFAKDRHYYDQLHSDTDHLSLDTQVIYVGLSVPESCDASTTKLGPLEKVPAYHRSDFTLFQMPFGCLEAMIVE